ncbi:hypothetical protein LSH36_872g03002 [Paralvinella palmiformis]|uniref:F-box domain-containing protein n=1 Tax=Paralvinella palmiformis TaxID=53620 RepID=A0AAD9MRW4_9ANNE|nr:hypothetical protein LSH36_872g03002 [Paralvinella palmiformis]
MGNQHPTLVNRGYLLRSKHDSPRYNRKICIYRVLGYFPGKAPDVDSLGFPFAVCKRIFLGLSLADLGSCMLVCKEWRSLIDTCDFWRAYIRRNYGNAVKDPGQNSALHWWKYNQADNVTPPGVDYADRPYVFKPFPELWRCDVIVPTGMRPPTGSVDVYHNFVRAMNVLRRIHDKIVCYGLSNIVHVCLFRWMHDDFKPSPCDVMDAFNAHALLRHDVEANSSGIVDDSARIVPPQGVDYRGQTYFIEVFSRCFQLGTQDWIVAFHCSHELLEPAPGFIMTLLTQGWVGGLLYAV